MDACNQLGQVSMSSSPLANGGPGPSSSEPKSDSNGSVKRARELLEAGVRPTPAAPPVPKPPPMRGVSHQTQWPLPASSLQQRTLNPHPRFLAPRGPPPARPPRPSEVPSQVPSPSTYSVRNDQGSGTSLSYAPRPAQSFSHPKPPQQPPPPRPYPNDGSCVSPAIPSRWGSGPAESEILGAYLDLDSDDDEHNHQNDQEDSASLVRSASVGKRGKPTIRTIMKPNSTSAVPVSKVPSSNPKSESNQEAASGALAVGVAVSQALHAPNPARRMSISAASNESCVDPEKPRFAQQDDIVYDAALEKEEEGLPNAAPMMSDKRPGARKPARLDMDAVRVAEGRGSLSSLSDLIRRATKLASNLDRGKTASRADLAADADVQAALGPRRRNSGSLSDILASFPNPALVTSEARASWPVFFGRSNLRNVEPLSSNEDGPDAKRAQRRCCGMPRKWFIVFCIMLFILVVLAILLPVFLVAVPQQSTSSAKTCAQTTPCKNGGVSVSSGTECSCVCSNGYTGSQCTTAGDSSCVMSEVENGTIAKNATMGSSLPRLFDGSQQKFGIKLDSVTIVALFSLNNISCKTENALVSFSDVHRSGSSSRRSVELPLDSSLAEEIESPSRSAGSTATAALLAARSTATLNGIVYDNSLGSQGSASQASSTKGESTSTSTATQTSSSATSTAEGSLTATATSVPDEVMEFSQVAVLYILQTTGSFHSALFSESQISSYLTDSYGKAIHPKLELLGEFGLDFENRTISTST